MSAKWRALQHRHRYTYNAVIFPHSYLHSLTLLPSDDLSLKFSNFLKQLASLNSIYSQVSFVKNVASSFIDVLSKTDDEGLVLASSRLYLELLFLENSLPIHRTLLSALSKNQKFCGLISGCFRDLCGEYGGFAGKGRRFCVSRAALSMMSTPKLGYLIDVVDECCVVVAFDVINGLGYMVNETNEKARPSPIVMEQCQEALSCLYYLLQRFPSKFVDILDSQNGLVFNGSSLQEMAFTVILSILKSTAFSRDCLVAAGVSFCAALQALLSAEELAYFIIHAVFQRKVCKLVTDADNDYNNAASRVPYTGDLIFELNNFALLSRLCLIRGILTAVSRTVLNFHFVAESEVSNIIIITENDEKCSQCILYDCILLELCHYCENPTDSHLNFHALTVMQICLQQIKTSILSDLVDWNTGFDPIPEDVGTRLMRIIWNNLEDTLSQTVKQVHLIFDLFLDIKATIHRADDCMLMSSFLQKIAADLLCLGARCKGRYVPLASIMKRLGAKSLIEMNSDLLFEVAQAYIDDDVCCAATSFLKCFLERLRDECWGSDGIKRGYEIYRGYCLPPFLHGLASGNSKWRSNLNTYALPSLLEVDVDSIFPMFTFLSVGVGVDTDVIYPELRCSDMDFSIDQKVAVLVSLLKVSRSLALFEGDINSTQHVPVPSGGCMVGRQYADIYIKGIQVKIPTEWLELALTHVDESLRVDAAESLFLNPKTASLPSSMELSLMRLSVPLNMRCSSTAFQMKWASLFRKFFSRVRTCLERQIKQGIWQPFDSLYTSNGSVQKGDDTIVEQANELYLFMKWLSCFLFFSCYPSAPYERKIMAMELLMIMVSVWSIVPPLPGNSDQDLYPFSEGLTRPDSTMLLVGSIIDSWDRLRESSFRILLSFPTPLPGLSSEDTVQELILWAKKLVCSPRVRESDAGALTLRLVFRKYVLQLGWITGASLSVISHKSESGLSNGDGKVLKSQIPVMQYINSLLDWLQVAVQEGEKDLTEACKNSFVHGVLLTLRYAFEELDWSSDIPASSISEMKCALRKLLDLVMQIASLALWVVSADAWYLPQDMDDIDEDSFLEIADETGTPESSLEHEAREVKGKQDVRPTEQIVMVGCWLAMKEVSLLLGTIIRKIPLPTATCSLGNEPGDATTDAVLDMNQLEAIGNHFLEVLLKMKHSGAIDKTRAGFTALCNRLLCSDDPRLCQLVESWMDQLMERTISKGQTVDDLLRRSAGIPAAFSAFFLSEPQGAPKKLLPRALSWLIKVAGGSLLRQPDVVQIVGKLTETSTDLKSSKIRVEGVIPTVHAFNVLKAAFNDANLATDTSGFSAEAMIISIRAFSSPHWEIRNSACLAYTALLRRMIGFLNVHKRASTRHALTSLEFFHRYPSLHSFVFNELEVATELLFNEKSKSTLASIVHPSLCPVLILLSRLRPSPIASELGDQLDPFVFMPFIQKCSTESDMRIRKLASRALMGLVSNEKLHSVLLDIASMLPKKTNFQGPCRSTSFNSIHGILLQLSALIDTNCRNLIELSLKDLILEDLTKTLNKCSWIGSPKLCPCPTLNTSFLEVLDHMLSIAGTCQGIKNYDVICGMLSELCSECLTAESFDGSTFSDPTAFQLRKQAVISYLRCVYLYEGHTEEMLPLPYSTSDNMPKARPLTKNRLDKVEKRLVDLLSDVSYEVRHATFKWLLQFVKAASTKGGDDGIAAIAHWAKANLQVTLIELLSKETHHKCVYYILRIIFAWNLSQYQKRDIICEDTVYIGVMDLDSLLLFWNKLVSIHESVSHTKTLETLICCFGLCIKCFAISLLDSLPTRESDELIRCTLLYDRIKHFVCLMKEYSDASQQVNLRKAASESILASGLLEQADLIGSRVFSNGILSESSQFDMHSKDSFNTFGFLILDLWFTCIKLMEDEDVTIRKDLASDVQKCFPEQFRSRFFAGLVPAQVEKVIELSFQFLSSVFGHWDQYFDYLLKWVLKASSWVVPECDMVRRVFDKELDNYHEEKLLICQICCSHADTIPVSKAQQPEFRNLLIIWRTSFFNQLMSFVRDHLEKLGGADWVSGVCNHKDAFLPLYGNLLGLYAVSKCILYGGIDDGMSLLSGITELDKSIRPFLKNPLVCNLYILVIRLHAGKDGADVNQLIAPLWDGFDPYFLLK
ncbi:uncharacterized protein LOC141592008 [Silene latifolia]|uniref:uncharacterized protein LOC141592008 n=1 Tax=Silene latifolia TaxID=37657 RepID=UPI003D78A8E1